MIINELLRWYQTKKNLRKFKDSVTLKGEHYEFKGRCIVKFLEGSNSDDVIFDDDVSILRGATLVTSNHGKIIIGKHSILHNDTLHAVDCIMIGDYSTLAPGVIVEDHNSHPVNPDYRKFMRTTPHGSNARSWIHSAHAPVKIGNNCWIGRDSRILKGVTIGDNSIVAAYSVVTKDVPANCIAAGNPAHIVKTDINTVPAPDSCEEYNDFVTERLRNGD